MRRAMSAQEIMTSPPSHPWSSGQMTVEGLVQRRALHTSQSPVFTAFRAQTDQTAL